MINEIEAAILEIFLSLQSGKNVSYPKSSDAAMLMLDLNELGMDSLERMDLIMRIEEKFDIALPESEVLKCKNLSELSWLVRRFV
jgi:acyl carrier protein